MDQTLATSGAIDMPDSIFKNIVLSMLIEMKAEQMIMKSFLERVVKGEQPMTEGDVEWLSRMTKDLVTTSFANVLLAYFGRIPDGILPDGIVGSAG